MEEEKKRTEEETETKEPENKDEMSSNETVEEEKELDYRKEYETLKKQYEDLVAEMHQKERQTQLDGALNNSKVRPENRKLLSKYLEKEDNFEEAISMLLKEFPHLFGEQETNFKNSLDIKDKPKEKKDDVDRASFGMVG